MGGQDIRKHLLRRYVVFRVKAIEFLDIVALRQSLTRGEFCPRTPGGRIPADFVDSLRTIHLSWFALFVDKSKGAMDVIKLWKELFPRNKTHIEEAWDRMKPAWNTLRTFRDKAGFHADKPLAFFKARTEILVQLQTVEAAVREFEQLFKFILRAESTELPDLEDALDCLLDELEANSPHRYKRNEFKRYLLFPNTRKATSASSNPQTGP